MDRGPNGKMSGKDHAHERTNRALLGTDRCYDGNGGQHRHMMILLRGNRKNPEKYCYDKQCFCQPIWVYGNIHLGTSK